MKKRNIRKPSEFSGDEVKGFFLVPKNLAAIALTKKLTGGEMRLWIYLQMIDPFADSTPCGEKVYHEIPSPAEIAIDLGVSADLVERAMRKLKKLGLYDHRVTEWQGFNCTAAAAKEESTRLKKGRAKTQSEQGLGLNNRDDGLNNRDDGLNNRDDGLNNRDDRLNNRDDGLNNRDDGLNNRDDRLNNLSGKAETQSQRELCSPSRSTDFTYFQISLSDLGERENFFNFVREKIANFSPKINDLEAFLASNNKTGTPNFRVYYELFRCEARTQGKFSQDWANHPRREEWLEYVRSNSTKWINNVGEVKEIAKGLTKAQRKEFLAWAKENELLRGKEL